MSQAQEDRVYIFDTTLRDGEQCRGAAMTLEEKVQIAAALDGMGVDIIEAGFPANEGDFEPVRTIAAEVQNAVVCGLARAVEHDIDRTAAALAPAKRKRIHTFIATSAIQMRWKLGMTPEEVYERVIASVTRARNYTDDVEWSCEDGSRSDREFLCRCIEAAINAGATTINVPDTVGKMSPERYAGLIRELRERVPNADKARFSVHCHDDLGLAVANSLAGVRAGARQVECTIFGLGERAGNAPLEEVVMAMRKADGEYPFVTNIDAAQFGRISKLVSRITGFPIAYNKAIIGRNSFAHGSGIHQHGVINNPATYEIMAPEEVGWTGTAIPFTKHSGRHGFFHKVGEMGFHLSAEQLESAFVRFQELARRKKEVFDEDIAALMDEKIAEAHERIKVVSLIVRADDEVAVATIILAMDGRHIVGRGSGNGSVDAVFDAVRIAVPHEASLELYQVSAVTEGADAQADVHVRLGAAGTSFVGHSAHPDTLHASAQAYVSALNKLLASCSQK